MSKTSNALASSRSVKLMITALLGLGLSACAAQVEGDEGDEGEGEGEVAQSAEALNRAFDFQLGIMAIRYNSRGQALKSSQAWTNPISYYNGYGNATSDSPFTSAFPGATGFRVAIKALGGAGSGPLFTDFRLRFQVRNSVTNETAPVGTTGWFSECSTVNCMNDIFEPFTNFNEHGWDQFKIGYDVRWWLTRNSSNEVTDFKLTAGACSTDVEATCVERAEMSTKSLSEMTPGEISWSHTAAPSDEGVLAFVEAGFISQGYVAK